MKKLIYLLVFAFVATSVFTSCEDDDDAKKVLKVKLGAQENTTVKGFYSIEKDAYYTLSEAAADQGAIDLLCFYEHEDGYINDITLAGPGSKIKGIFEGDFNDWTTKNETRFSEVEGGLTDIAWDALVETSTAIQVFYNEQDNNRKAKLLQVGDVYAFKTAGGKYGIFKVTAVKDGKTGSVEFELKMQK